MYMFVLEYKINQEEYDDRHILLNNQENVFHEIIEFTNVTFDEEYRFW